MAFSLKSIDWQAAQRAFVERSPRPTYEELATEFGCSIGSLGRLSSENGWPALRAQFMDAQLLKADAAGIMLEACKVDRSLLHKASSFAITLFEKLAICVEAVKAENSAQTQAQALNTASFAFKNVAEGLRSLGIIGVSRTLDREGKGGNNQWEPGMLQQINVNLSGLQAAVQAATPAPASAPTPPAVEPSIPV